MNGGAIVLFVFYLIIGFFIAMFMKFGNDSPGSTGEERLLWCLAWPFMLLWKAVKFVVSVFED